MIRQLIGMEIDDVLSNTDSLLKNHSIRSVEDVQKLAFNIVGFSEDMHRRNRSLKDFLFSNLYRHYRVQRMSFKADQILTKLFSTYIDEPTILPKHIHDRMQKSVPERVVCDYIAGMTDRFAVDEYQKLFDPTILP